MDLYLKADFAPFMDLYLKGVFAPAKHGPLEVIRNVLIFVVLSYALSDKLSELSLSCWCFLLALVNLARTCKHGVRFLRIKKETLAF